MRSARVRASMASACADFAAAKAFSESDCALSNAPAYSSRAPPASLYRPSATPTLSSRSSRVSSSAATAWDPRDPPASRERSAWAQEAIESAILW